MKKLLISIIVLATLISCKQNEFKEKHDKYRTLMYRSNFKQCFVDSCRKYGLLYDSVLGFVNKSSARHIDTIPFNGREDCN